MPSGRKSGENLFLIVFSLAGPPFNTIMAGYLKENNEEMQVFDNYFKCLHIILNR
jgi:hypothetical protein